MKRGIASAVAALLLLGLLVGCDFGALLASEAEAPRAAKTSEVVSLSDGTAAKMVTGQTGPGSLYALYKPTTPAWNGKLVIYAHGYVKPGQDIDLPHGSGNPAENPEGYLFSQLQQHFLSEGYGLAYSSYSETGWAVKDGMTRTRQLIGLYTSRFGRPTHTYLIGASMGGAVAAALAEKNPQLFDGIITIGGPLAGPVFQFQHVLNARVLFDALFDAIYPDLLPGDAYDVAEDVDFDVLLYETVPYFILTNPMVAMKIPAVDQVCMPWQPTAEYYGLGELIQMIVTPLWFSLYGTNDMLDRTHGHIPVGNADIVYTDAEAPYASTPDEMAALNLAVDRFESTRDAENYLDHWYVPTGRIGVPMICLHNTRDPAVPYSHETAFAQIVAAAGRSSLLKQVAVNSFGHCVVSAQDVIDAFELLSPTGP